MSTVISGEILTLIKRLTIIPLAFQAVLLVIAIGSLRKEIVLHLDILSMILNMSMAQGMLAP